MDELTKLPNIGEKLSAELVKAGVSSADQLRKLGSIETILRLTGGKPLVGYNILYAIEGAVRGVRWHSIPKEELHQLRENYKRAIASDMVDK